MPGRFGQTDNENGAFGSTKASDQFGVFGSNESDNPPSGGGAGGSGVFGLSVSPGAAGVFGANNSAKGVGVQGDGPDAGISGFSDHGVGIRGHSNHATGIEGFAHVSDQTGVFGVNDAGGSVSSTITHPAGNGVWGHTNVEKGSGIYGSVEPGVTTAAGVTGVGPLAGQFFGNVTVTGKVTADDFRCAGADCAEEFVIAAIEAVVPGTVMIIAADGALLPSDRAYDKRVAGVISGAGNYKPGVILDCQWSRSDTLPLALVGKVYCKVDAQYGPIEVGDLLTTSPTPGHAMKAQDQTKAFGSVIGKSLRSHETGQGLISILIALQ